jgi:pyruvate-formate lyase-activating enzyme
MPFLDYDVIDIRNYIADQENYAGVTYKSGHQYKKKTLALITSRGCPGTCTFCCAHTVHGRRVRTFSLDKTIETIAFLYREYGVNTFSIYDDFFTFNKKRVLEFAAGIKALFLDEIHIQFEGTATINSLDEELIDAMIELGLDYCVMPLESGSEYVQKNIIKKNVRLDHAFRMAEYMRSKNVFVNGYIIFGFPNETRELMMETLTYALNFPADRFFFFSATPYLGSEMTKEFLQIGCFVDERDLISRHMSADERSFDMPGMTAAELNDFKYRANLLCNFSQNIVMRNKEWEVGYERFSRIFQRYPFHIIALKCKAICCRNLNKEKEAEEIELTLERIIKNDPLAAEMYQKYYDIYASF